MEMIPFATQKELLMSYAAYVMQTGNVEKRTAEIMAQSAAHYSPAFYKGGWVIPGFGYSTERVGVYVKASEAGRPERVGTRLT